MAGYLASRRKRRVHSPGTNMIKKERLSMFKLQKGTTSTQMTEQEIVSYTHSGLSLEGINRNFNTSSLFYRTSINKNLFMLIVSLRMTRSLH